MCPGSGQNLFHVLAMVLGQLLIEVPVEEQASLEGRDCSGDVTFGKGPLLLIEAGYVASQRFCPMVEDLYRPSEVFSMSLLLANYSTNLPLWIANEAMNLEVSVDRHHEFGRRAYDLYGNRKFSWEEKNEYGIYRDDQGCERGMDGHIINISKENIIRLLERASKDEPSYICLLEHATYFTQTKLVPEIYTKDEINEMLYGVCGEQENNKEAFQMKLDGVYHPLNDGISWLTTCMEEMRQDIARIQQATEASRQTSIDRGQHASINCRLPTSIDQRLPASIDIKERLDERCDDIYFPMDLSISALTSKIEAMQGELVEIQRYIARRPEASASVDRRNNKSTDIHHQTSVDDATNLGRLVPKMKYV
ncbi:hypothetical protein F2Q68_00025326 [Brassica cretica]|uniref:Uncharacterized protein n=2 Tax=Brassica cretica TaxID=69181 RepID=A0ABQ7BII9_BRACR|nr:hypothetical protein F2Q68_00025326 [Brassica cretica]KAF3532088.1 hypothetical protein DY000_02039918 [Brassica cretica]